MATPHLQNYIDGRWTDSASGEAFEDLDPASGQIIAWASMWTTAEVDRAVVWARRAFDAWRLFPSP
jgi:acyl-CoA reductase-like NAD-dependent aldehyde dehydrogenase